MSLLVTVNGVRYVPLTPQCDNPTPLDVRMHVNDLGEEVSLREYLHKLLATLWNEGESFSGKRPFGNSGWEYDIYAFLVAGGAVTGDLDSEGCLNEFDEDAANKLMPGLLAAAFGLGNKGE